MAEERLGRYRLLSLIATGGMGEVFLARQEGPAGFSKTVVVKRILRHLAKDQGFIDLFLNEAQLAAQLQHPSIVQVFGLEREGDTWFMAMEYVPGKSLRSLLDSCRQHKLSIPPPIAVRVVSQVLQGLEFAHQLKDEHGRALGILHRDVTPENVLLATTGMAKIVDFGIARAMRGTETRVGMPKGKLAYMAPELMVAGSAIDRRADVFGAGVLLRELLTLQRPPQGPLRDDGSMIPTPFAALEGIPDALNEALARAVAVDPKDRWDSARQMSEGLENWLTTSGHTVLPSDITRFLVSVYGEAGTQPAPVAIGDDVGNTGIHRVGTAALAHPPGQDIGLMPTLAEGPARSRTEPLLQPVIERIPTPPPAPPEPPRRTGLLILLAGGVATAAVFLLITVIGIVGSQNRVEAPAPVVLPVPKPPSPTRKTDAPAAVAKPIAPKPIVMPEMVLDGSDAGAGKDPSGPVIAAAKAVPLPKKVVAPPPAVKRPKTGRVTFRVHPWAEVYLANRKIGVTPFEPIDVPAGEVTFTLKNAQLGVTRRIPVKVLPGKSFVVRSDLFKGSDRIDPIPR